jgi:DNA-binding XRE family transcriptional regulator
MKTNLIYGLMDPRNDLFYYVGKTTVGENRPLAHLTHSHNEMVKNWVAELEKINMSPSVCVIERDIDISELRNREIYWINEYRRVNDELFNIKLIEKKEISSTIQITNATEIEYIFENFSLICKSIRVNLGLSQDELSKMVNVSRSTISLLERGCKNVAFGTVLDILKLSFSNTDRYRNELNIKIYGKNKRSRTPIANK